MELKISWFVQVLLNFYWFWGSIPWEWGWVDGGVWGGGCVRGSPMHAHTHACMHTHMDVKHDKNGYLHVCGHLQFLYMYTCVCMHAHACAHVWGHPHAPRHPPTHLSLPRATGSPKHKNSMSLELIKIFQFCLKILYLWTLLNSYTL